MWSRSSPPASIRTTPNFGFWVAGEIVTAVSGQPLDAYVDNHILGPLDMEETDLTPEPSTAALAVGYRARSPGKARRPWPFTDTRFYTPAGDGASTIQDLTRPVSLFMSDADGGPSPVIKRSTLREMQGEEGAENDRGRLKGLGVFVQRVGDQVRISHSGDGGGFVASFGVEPVNKFGVIVLANSDDGEAWEYRSKAFKIVAPGLSEALEAPDAIAAVEAGLERYVGTYRWEDWTVEFLVLDGQLTMIDSVAGEPWLVPEGPDTFRMMEVDDTFGERMHFVLDANGSVTAVRFPSWYALRESEIE